MSSNKKTHKLTWEQREEEMKICLIEQGFGINFGVHCCTIWKPFHIPARLYLKILEILTKENGIDVN